MPRRSSSPASRRDYDDRRRSTHDERDRRDSYSRSREDEDRRNRHSYEGGSHQRHRDHRGERDTRRDHRDKEEEHYSRAKQGSSRIEHRRQRSLSEDEDFLDLRKLGVERIRDDDYFLKSGEFKYWLKDSRGKYLDELSSENAHKYFRKFARRWNDGALKEKYYFPPKGGSSSSTGYKWTFNSKSKDEPSKRRSPAAEVQAEWREKTPPLPAAPDDTSDDEIGPSLPPSAVPRAPAITTADLQLAKEEASDRRRAERKAERREAYNRADEIVPRAIGKEGKMQEKRAANEENKKYREKDATEGFEADEGTLMGDSGSFHAALRAREAAQAKRQEQREAVMADRVAADQERLLERKRKESDTMDMFKALAKQRFG